MKTVSSIVKALSTNGSSSKAASSSAGVAARRAFVHRAGRRPEVPPASAGTSLGSSASAASTHNRSG